MRPPRLSDTHCRLSNGLKANCEDIEEALSKACRNCPTITNEDNDADTRVRGGIHTIAAVVADKGDTVLPLRFSARVCLGMELREDIAWPQNHPSHFTSSGRTKQNCTTTMTTPGRRRSARQPCQTQVVGDDISRQGDHPRHSGLSGTTLHGRATTPSTPGRREGHCMATEPPHPLQVVGDENARQRDHPVHPRLSGKIM